MQLLRRGYFRARCSAARRASLALCDDMKNASVYKVRALGETTARRHHGGDTHSVITSAITLLCRARSYLEAVEIPLSRRRATRNDGNCTLYIPCFSITSGMSVRWLAATCCGILPGDVRPTTVASPSLQVHARTLFRRVDRGPITSRVSEPRESEVVRI